MMPNIYYKYILTIRSACPQDEPLLCGEAPPPAGSIPGKVFFQVNQCRGIDQPFLYIYGTY